MSSYNNEYKTEVKERFGETQEYREYAKKTAHYSQEKWQQVNDGLDCVFSEFADCMKSGYTDDSEKAQDLVKELRRYITENYYTCDKEVLKSLGLVYVSDERFRNNIDKHAVGTACFVSKAIEIYCR